VSGGTPRTQSSPGQDERSQRHRRVKRFITRKDGKFYKRDIENIRIT
jgi:hypothetical protein